jgi:hypothetical protein
MGGGLDERFAKFRKILQIWFSINAHRVTAKFLTAVRQVIWRTGL